MHLYKKVIYAFLISISVFYNIYIDDSEGAVLSLAVYSLLFFPSKKP
jgi:hypothetical protein